MANMDSKCEEPCDQLKPVFVLCGLESCTETGEKVYNVSQSGEFDVSTCAAVRMCDQQRPSGVDDEIDASTTTEEIGELSKTPNIQADIDHSMQCPISNMEDTHDACIIVDSAKQGLCSPKPKQLRKAKHLGKSPESGERKFQSAACSSAGQLVQKDSGRNRTGYFRSKIQVKKQTQSRPMTLVNMCRSQRFSEREVKYMVQFLHRHNYEGKGGVEHESYRKLTPMKKLSHRMQQKFSIQRNVTQLQKRYSDLKRREKDKYVRMMQISGNESNITTVRKRSLSANLSKTPSPNVNVPGARQHYTKLKRKIPSPSNGRQAKGQNIRRRNKLQKNPMVMRCLSKVMSDSNESPHMSCEATNYCHMCKKGGMFPESVPIKLEATNAIQIVTISDDESGTSLQSPKTHAIVNEASRETLTELEVFASLESDLHKLESSFKYFKSIYLK